jgi:hypothetical protein
MSNMAKNPKDFAAGGGAPKDRLSRFIAGALRRSLRAVWPLQMSLRMARC